MRKVWIHVAGLAGLVTGAVALATPASAQDVNRIIGTLNAIVNPQDALRQEERARREGREEERRYWRDYRAGLEHRRPEAEHEPNRQAYRGNYIIGAEEARRHEEEARRRHRLEDERYWREYRAGLEHGREEGRNRYDAPAPREEETRPYRDQRNR